MLVCALRGVGGEMDASTSKGVAVEKGPHENGTDGRGTVTVGIYRRRADFRTI